MPHPLTPQGKLESLLAGLPPQERALVNALGQQMIAEREAQDSSARGSRRAATPSPSAALQPITPEESEESEVELAAREARLQRLRTQEIGQIAEAALVNIVDEGDAQAHAFQREQMAALRDELAPPGSPIAERLLAEAIVKARFEYLMWSARADYHILHPSPKPDMFVAKEPPAKRAAKDKAHRAYKARAFAEERARLAEKRYLSTLRDLDNLRRQNVLLQVNQVHISARPIPSARSKDTLQAAPTRQRSLRQRSAPPLDAAGELAFNEITADAEDGLQQTPSTWETSSIDET